MAMLNNQSVIIYTIVIWYVMNYMVSNCSLICRLTGLFKICAWQITTANFYGIDEMIDGQKLGKHWAILEFVW